MNAYQKITYTKIKDVLEKARLPRLTSMQSAGVAPEVNLRNSLHTGDKACKRGIHPDFETQGRHCQKSKTRGISGYTKRTSKNFKKKTRFFGSVCLSVYLSHFMLQSWDVAGYEIKVSVNRVFQKHTKLKIMAILASEYFLRKNIQQQNVTPVSIEPGTSPIQI